jgi:hypothetical protein
MQWTDHLSRSPTECSVSVYDHEASTMRSKPTRAVEPRNKKAGLSLFIGFLQYYYSEVLGIKCTCLHDMCKLQIGI